MVRAPWPHKPKGDIARSLRGTLAIAWRHVSQGQTDRAHAVLELAVIHAICDLEGWTVVEWEAIRDELVASRPQ